MATRLAPALALGACLLGGCLEEAVPPRAALEPPSTPSASTSGPASVPPTGSPSAAPLPAAAPLDDPLSRTDHIPQLRDAWSLFGEMKDGPLPSVEGAVLLCDVRVPSSGIFFRRPDILGKLTLRGGTTQRLIGANNREATVLTAPLHRLATGDSVELVLEDRDLFSRNDFLDRARAEYAGAFPMLLVGEQRKLHGTCRVLRPDAVAARYDAEQPAADAAVSAYGASITPDPTRDQFGHPGVQLRAAQDAILGLVALRGWADGPAGALKARLARHRGDWTARAAEAVASARAAATPLGTPADLPGGGSLTVLRHLCGAEADAARRAMRPELDSLGGCALELELTPGPSRLAGVLPDGSTGALRVDAAERDGQPIDPLRALEGAGPRRLLAAPQADLLSAASDAARDAVLLRATHRGQAAFFAL